MYRHVLWDFDGTLFDTYPSMTYALKTALSEKGIDEDENEIYAHLKVRVGPAVTYFAEKHGLDSDLHTRFLEIRREVEKDMCRPYPGLVSLMEDVIAAGGYHYINTHRGASTWEILEVQGMRHLFRDGVTTENKLPPKPDPASVNFLIEKYGMDRSEVIMIGDRELDVLSGQNAGVTGCAYSDGTGSPIPCADVTAANMEELRKILLG